MEINKETTIKLTPKDLEEIITQHLKEKGFTTKHIIFDVNGHNQPGDWQSAYGQTYTLDNVICKCEELNNI